MIPPPRFLIPRGPIDHSPWSRLRPGPATCVFSLFSLHVFLFTVISTCCWSVHTVILGFEAKGLGCVLHPEQP